MNRGRIALALVPILAGLGAAAPSAHGQSIVGPATLASVEHNWTVKGSSTRVTELTVTRISPATATVDVVCAGRGCPFKTRRFKTRNGKAVIGPAFRGKRLAAGGRIDVVVVAPGTTGRLVSFEMRRSRIPTRTAACAASGSTSPVGCPGPAGPQGPQGPAGPQGPSGGGLTNPYVFRAYKIAAQDTPAAGYTKVLLGGESFDPHSDFDPAASRYTAPVTGFYQFSARVDLCCAGGRAFAQIVASAGGGSIRGTDGYIPSGIHASTVSGMLHLKRGDTVELQIWTERVNSVPAAERSNLTFFSGFLVSAG